MSGQIKDGYKQQSQLFRALSHPVRLRILDTLARQEACVCHLTALLRQRQPYVSQQLATLREAGLVDCQSNGPLRCYYILRPSLVKNLFACQPERHPVRQRTRESVLNELKRSRKEVQ